MSLDLSTLLPWTKPKPLETKAGPRLLRSAPANETFWGLWRERKEELKASGISCAREDDGQWIVNWWTPIEAKAPEPVRDYVRDGGRFKLRDYQREAVNRSVHFLKEGEGNGIAVEPTGSGKSLVIANVVQALDEPTLIFQPSKEILEQNFSKLVSYGYKPAIFSASFDSKRIGDITLATIGSAIKARERFRHVRNILIDECHSVDAKSEDSMFMQFIRSVPEARILGLTATPYRLVTDGYGGSMLKFITRTRPRVFSEVVHHAQIGDLLRQGYLAKMEYRSVKGIQRDRLRLNSTGADYTEESMRNHFAELNFSDKIVRCVFDALADGMPNVLVFTRFVEEAQYVASRIKGAEIVTAETPSEERRSVIERFRSGACPCVCNVGVLSTGFDFPALACVVLARPTKSLALHYQMIGRAMRPHPNKDRAVVVDMVELTEEFGPVEDLVLDPQTNGKWIVRSGERQLTNIYYGERANPEKSA